MWHFECKVKHLPPPTNGLYILWIPGLVELGAFTRPITTVHFLEENSLTYSWAVESALVSRKAGFMVSEGRVDAFLKAFSCVSLCQAEKSEPK